MKIHFYHIHIQLNILRLYMINYKCTVEPYFAQISMHFLGNEMMGKREILNHPSINPMLAKLNAPSNGTWFKINQHIKLNSPKNYRKQKIIYSLISKFNYKSAEIKFFKQLRAYWCTFLGDKV